MINRISEKLMNKKGSSLAFVLIIGMIIMIMVASLLAVANSDNTFTQESVESRQAYIDAKSVIEFGKIEINKRMTELTDKNAELVNKNIVLAEKIKNKESTVQIELDIKNLEEAIAGLEAKLENDFYIYGDDTKVNETLTDQDLSTADDIILLGKGTVKKTTSYEYQFTIETQSLRRKLDYQSDFSYRPTTSSTVISGTPDAILGKPTVDWNKSFFHVAGGNVKKSGSQLNADFTGGNVNIDINKGFVWDGNTTLILKADNICVTDSMPITGVEGKKVNITALGTPAMPATKKTPATVQRPGQIRFETNYNQVNSNKNTFIADNIIFMGDLVIDDKSYLEIKCANLWVVGNIIIKTNNPADPAFINRITATNIIVGGSPPNNKTITVDNKSRVVWTYDKFYLNSQITTAYPNSGTSGGGNVVVTPGATENGQEKYY